MKITNFLLVLICFLFCLGLTVNNVKAQSFVSGLLLTVDNNGDSVDINQGDGICADASGQCTLRAALQEANANPSGDAINFTLPQPSVINLTLGQLQITASVAIVGPGARRLTVERSFNSGTPDFRIFDVSRNAGTSISIRGLTIKNGNAGEQLLGGGIYIEQDNNVIVNDVAISNNSATVGGGIFNAGNLNLTRSLVNSNSAGSRGGAIVNLDGLSAATVSNSTITNNSALTSGAIDNGASLLLINDTITGNSAANAASSIFNNPNGTINVLNTIIGNDAATNVTTLSGAFNSLGNNLITDARDSTGFTNGVNNDQVSNNNAINPLLGDLADNGGQTDTRNLQTGSPAINAGNNCVFTRPCSSPIPSNILLRSDQRYGYSRLTGDSVDIGAFETGATISNSSGSLILGLLGFSHRQVRAIAILTNARTGEKTYRVSNVFGSIIFQNLAGNEVYILEIQSKGVSFPSPRVFEF